MKIAVRVAELKSKIKLAFPAAYPHHVMLATITGAITTNGPIDNAAAAARAPITNHKRVLSVSESLPVNPGDLVRLTLSIGVEN